MAKVVIYDSGVGGLSIYQAVVRVCPQHDYVFLSDNAAFPYGTKPEDALLARVSLVVAAAIERLSPDLLVVACNTASTVALPMLRANYSIPIVGVVPAIKPAALSSISKQIALLATPATIERAYTQALIDEFAADCMVVKIGSSELVELAEKKLRGEVIDNAALTKILTPVLNNKDIDTLVLACTHFPLLATEIEAVFVAHDRAVKLVDSGPGIARRVADLAPVYSGAKLGQRGCSTAMFTRSLNAPQLQTNLADLGFSNFAVLDIPG
ncbi:glutamate racemase [Arenicella xantha]|uniref:Glutamate racemase n=1 Tax=Arenicella xantha TaxID=644221 RepID=A0A395JG04_9GAMM|nr:glutamate racemase [Arenicella xantha]RBP48351.1 glutamate racemase [Arenicella xantha]